MHTKKWIFLVVCLGVILMAAPKTHAGEIDILVGKLVEKGILTRAEADEILTETKAEVKRQNEAVQNDALPVWIQKTKLTGDFRVRHDYKRKKNNNEADVKARIRYRLGFETKVNDQVTVGAGLATGGSSPTSTNIDLENSFDTPDIGLDYGFAEYTPTDWARMVAGKFKRDPYLWATTDMVWDSDVRPEGASLNLHHKVMKNVKGFFNTGVWILDENGATDKADPFMHYVQGGLKWKDADYDAKVAAIYYGFNEVQGYDPDSSDDTNTRISTTDNGLKYDYNSVGVSAEAGVAEPLSLPLQRVAVFGDYITNVADNVDLDTGWAWGIKFGDKKVGEKGSWQGKYMYVNLGRDAFIDVFADGDRVDGGTDVRSHEVILQYGLLHNVIYEIDYYMNKRIKAAENEETVVQNSLMFKF